tara:strand:+ start:8528 stop:8908 length:381 start_codon:yes stop_codon:yes gene_type:complete
MSNKKAKHGRKKARSGSPKDNTSKFRTGLSGGYTTGEDRPSRKDAEVYGALNKERRQLEAALEYSRTLAEAEQKANETMTFLEKPAFMQKVRDEARKKYAMKISFMNKATGGAVMKARGGTFKGVF